MCRCGYCLGFFFCWAVPRWRRFLGDSRRRLECGGSCRNGRKNRRGRRTRRRAVRDVTRRLPIGPPQRAIRQSAAAAAVVVLRGDDAGIAPVTVVESLRAHRYAPVPCVKGQSSLGLPPPGFFYLFVCLFVCLCW